MKETILKIKKLIAVDKIEEALNSILSINGVDKEYVNETIVNSSKFFEISSLDRKGVIDRNSVAIEKTQIRYALLEIVDKIEKSKPEERELPTGLFSVYPMEVLSSLTTENSIINSHFEKAKKKLANQEKEIKKLEKFKFLYNCLSRRRIESISKKNFHAVSYTHLTLPTICSV